MSTEKKNVDRIDEKEKRTVSTISIGQFGRNGTLLIERRREMTPQREAAQKAQVTALGRLTPEVASRMDLDELYLAGIRYTGRCLRGRPRHLRTELVHDGWVLLSTTKRWDPSRLPLERWFVLILRNLINDHNKQGPEIDPETAAQYGNYERVERHVEAMAPDEVLVEREDRAERARITPLLLVHVEGIEAAVAHNAVAVAILQEWKTNGCDLKPQQLADRLGFSPYHVKKAREVIQYHAKRLSQGEPS